MITAAIIIAFTLTTFPAIAQNIPSANENIDRAKQWNDFADGLFLVHRKRLETISIKKTLLC